MVIFSFFIVRRSGNPGGNHQKINSTSRKNIRRGFWRSGGKNKNHYPVKKRAAITKPKNTICNKEMLLSKDTNIPTVWLE